jgi:alpha-tubulin suppressor-like RCC1 family protein
MFGGSIVKPGFNPLAAQTPSYTYYLQAWGFNTNGELGLNNTELDKSSPNQVGSLTDWAFIAAGSNHHVATKTDGSLWTWGKNADGQLGKNNTTDFSSPVQVGSDYNWGKVSAHGLGTGYSIKTNGTLWAWGKNTSGQLGLNTAVSISSPVQVGVLTTWLSVAAGYRHCLAIKTDGTLWAWGFNNDSFGAVGQLGDNTAINRSSPVQIGALTTWLKISAGGYHSIALKTDGTMWSWGQNENFGALGLGDKINRSSPVQIGALTTWSNFACGNYHVIAAKTDGTLWAWGYNSVQAQLGDNTAINRSSPVQIGALTTWATPCAGQYHSYAITTSGALYSWGRNHKGQLGTNVTSYSVSSPVQVGSNTTWFFATGGLASSLALLY